MSVSAVVEPPERAARPAEPGRAPLAVAGASPAAVLEALAGWSESLRDVSSRSLSSASRARLGDHGRIAGELDRVLRGLEPGEGTDAGRALHVALAGRRVQAVSATFACPAGTFVELLVAAPWNVLGDDEPRDLRTVRGAGTALLAAAVAASAARGLGGRVALQAENPRTLAFYERLGFRRMAPADDPLALVPRGADGWSASILRLARGAAGPEEERTPWLVLAPGSIPPRLAPAAARVAHAR